MNPSRRADSTPRDTYRKKLIEVALPLEAINAESAREKSIRHGHPSTLHLWWARRPLAACRAVIFSQLVDDPGSVPEEFPTEEAQEKERQRIFRIIERMVKWENSSNDEVLHEARMEIARSVARDKRLKFDPKTSKEACLAFLQEHAPPVLDPFCGGGSIPLEAQRLGLRAYASDLNPVAVLITKALIEIPPKFAGKSPVNPEARKHAKRPEGWKGAQGLAEDVRYYGQWMRNEAEKRIGHLYPKAKLKGEFGEGEAAVIAWLWARTVKCPNPACGAQMPLVRNFALSTKRGKETWVEPQVNGKEVTFQIRTSGAGPEEGTKQRSKSRCLVCRSDNITDATLRDQATRFGMGAQLMAVVAEGDRGRIYLSPNGQSEVITETPKAEWVEQPLPDNARWFSPPGYGMKTFRDLFTPRQLVAVTTFSDLVKEAIERACRDAAAAGLPNAGEGIEEGGTGARAYAEAVGLNLTFGLNKFADLNNALVTWKLDRECPVHLFARQAIPMCWDYVEANPFSESSGSWEVMLDHLVPSMSSDVMPAIGQGHRVNQLDATASVSSSRGAVVSTDPPYYDNIGYADLSDFFYVWFRKSMGAAFPRTLSTLLTPKDQELIATPYRFGGDRGKAMEHFESGSKRVFESIAANSADAYPIAIWYAYKQAESEEGLNEDTAVSSTGWETFLEALRHSELTVDGTWPIRSEMKARQIAAGANALASSIVLACRPRPKSAPMATRQEFIRALKAELPTALRTLQHGSIAPVDLQQAAIGPGMAVFTRYAKVMEASGGVMNVRTALQIINQVRDEVVSEQETDLDPDTRWCLAWFKQRGMNEGPFGEAEVLSRAMNTAVNGLVEAGVIKAEKGKVRLLKREELPDDYDPREDQRPTVWEATQHLAKALETGGEKKAAELAKKLGGVGELAKELAYILFEVCNKNKWSQEAIPYNSLVVAWPEISRMTQSSGLEKFG